MTEETKQPEEQQQPETQAAAPTRRRAAKAKQPEHGIKNMRSGDMNIGGRLFMKPGQVVELTADHKKDKRLMKKIEHGVKTGVLAEV